MKRQDTSAATLIRLTAAVLAAAALISTAACGLKIIGEDSHGYNINQGVVVVHECTDPAVPKVALGTEDSQHGPAQLLDLIGKTEGTDKGDGYNETLAYGAFTNGDVVLTDMTLAEIDDLQTTMLQHPENRWNSSAIGRYQIVRTTLRSLKKELGLEDTLLFTADLQDRLAIELLETRGYQEWTAGLMSDEQFALNLSKEWASLPNPSTGTGYYSGQNAAVDYDEVKLVLRSMQ